MSVQPFEDVVAGDMTDEQIAQMFGQSYIVMEQDPDLKQWFLGFADRFRDARGQISYETFKLELEQQPWWIDNSATYIADIRKELENPTDYAQEINSEVAELRRSAANVGATMLVENEALLREFAKNARRLGWNQQQTLDALVEYVAPTATGDLRGAAGLAQAELKQWAMRNGVMMTDNDVLRNAQQIASGMSTLDDVKDDLRRTYLAGAYPAWSDRIEAGQDVYDIAAPYRQRMGNLLEVDPESIDFSDGLLQRSLQNVGADGKPRVMPLYEFEQEIRKDPRWEFTDNAYDVYSRVGENLLRTFGFR